MNTIVEEVENTQNNENGDDEGAENDAETVEILPGYASFDDYLKKAFDAMRTGIKAANSLPTGDNFNYYSCFSKFNETRNKEAKKLLNLMQGVLTLSGAAGNMKQCDTDEQFELLVDANDKFLDRASACMDEEEGTRKKLEVALIVSQTTKKNVFGSWNATVSEPGASIADTNANGINSIRLLAGRNVQRPQLNFKDKIDNSSKPWQPRITDKPNSLKPLALYLEQGENGDVFNHPYEFELEKFEPPEIQLRKRDPVMYKALEDTPLIIIEKLQDLKILIEDLGRYKEIAVDLEHHSYRTFQGITCLMQISTRDTDYLIDTLTLRSELHALNEIFTKPSILKVFHGADSDIHWLQRDLSLYVVNMFDTYHAAKQLDLPYLSLAYLMKRYCNLDPNKHFQLADWRIRPLPEELMKYAREDTHYLLYIKDILSNDLITSANEQTNIIRAVYDRSTQVCKRVYEKPIWIEESFMNMYRKSQKMFNNKQLYALRELHKWRDDVARQEDDSTGYVLPNHMLLNIAETLPREMQGILACCNPIPPLVRQHLLKLHKFILKAREQPLIKPVLEQDIRQRLTQRNQAANSDVWIFTPHDIPSGMEVRANLPCLLDNEKPMNIVRDNTTIDHIVTVFDGPTESDQRAEAMERRRILRKKKTMFVSPFERYKRVMPMVAAQEERERKKLEEAAAARNRVADTKEEETAKSIERVREHFKNVAQNIINPEDIDGSSNEQVQVPLGQMHGQKRKRQTNFVDSTEYREDSKYDVSTPKPSLDATISQNCTRKRKSETMDYHESSKEMKCESKTTINSTPMNKRKKKGRNKGNCQVLPAPNPHNQTNLPFKKCNAYGGSQLTNKEQKAANRKELKRNGMLPEKNFDYKSVDFSSFQGGSTAGGASKSAPFQPQKKKNKGKKGKKRKKIGGI